MSPSNTSYPTIASLISKGIIIRASVVALVLGSILTLFNQPNVIFGSAALSSNAKCNVFKRTSI